jgi:transcriptional regulator with XRE-family HTH domain/tetratricopeptide (TPR) repeat protein
MASSGRRRPNVRLRAKRHERGLTQEELADELSRLRWQTDPDGPPITSGMVSRWERGQRPHQHHRRLLCEFFGTREGPASTEDLGLRVWPPVDDESRSSAGRYDGLPGGAAAKRRDFIVGAAGTIATLAGAPLTDPLLTALGRLNHLAGFSIGAAVDGFETVLADLGASYSQEPVVRIYARLDGLLSVVQGLIDSNPPAAYRRRLQAIAGWSAGLLANALYDLGDSAAASANAALALEYGRLSSDARLMAYVRGRQAMFAEDSDHWPEAFRLIRKGLQVAPERTAIDLRLRCTEAIMNARLGRQEEAGASAQQLQTVFDQLPMSEIGEGAFNVSAVFLRGATALTLIWLGDLETAEQDVRAVINHYAAAVGPARRPTRLANARLDLSHILMRQGRPDEAALTAGEALTADRLVAGVLRQAGRFEAALSQRYPELPEARDFREKYMALEAAARPPAEP